MDRRMPTKPFADLDDRTLMEKTGEALYGDRFATALGRGLSVAPDFVRQILKEVAKFPPRQRASMRDLCTAWERSVDEKRALIRALGDEWRRRADEEITDGRSIR
jgi:hypothetical protein